MSMFVTRARIPYSSNTKKPKNQRAQNVRFANIAISVNLVSLVNIVGLVNIVNLVISVIIVILTTAASYNLLDASAARTYSKNKTSWSSSKRSVCPPLKGVENLATT